MTRDNRTLLDAILGDGRPLLLLTGLSLVIAGLFAIFQAGTGHFLPHDVYFLGMNAADLCFFYECRILHFMIHDRVAFGGALVAIGALYLWLAEFPLRQRQGWAWWAFLFSGLAGFASFLTYLGYSYLDSWHGVATLVLLPCWVAGLVRSYQVVQPRSLVTLWREKRPHWDWRTRQGQGMILLAMTVARQGQGMILLAMTVAGLLGAGLFIMIGGMIYVFVPQDLAYLGLKVADLHAISPQLIPLIADDRSGFGGALFAAGIAMGFCVCFAQPSKSLWQVLLVAGASGFGCAIGIHFPMGYPNLIHLLPAYVGSVVFTLGMVLLYQPMMQERRELLSAKVRVVAPAGARTFTKR